MKISSHPELMSRRAALASIGAGLTTLLQWPADIRAHERRIPEFSFIVVSDTHLGRNDRSDAADLWTKTAAEIDKGPGEFVLHIGDVVDAGREKQYDVYKDIRKSIRKPVHEIPGNHDPEELFAKHIRREVDTAIDHRGVRFLLLNNSRFGEIDGFISPKRIQWISHQCDDAAKKNLFVIPVMHVAAHDNRFPDAGAYVKPKNGQTDYYAILDRHKDRVLASFHGHFHCGLRGWSDRGSLHEIVFPSALYNRNQLITELKAPGYNLPEFRRGYVLASIGPAGLKLKYKPVGVSGTSDKTLPFE
jgi:calcineurin-like phosphoesterase family protein